MRFSSALGAEDRSLFTARFAEQMEVAEVAAAHRMTLATAKRRLARLIKRLGAKMSRDPLLEPYVNLDRQARLDRMNDERT